MDKEIQILFFFSLHVGIKKNELNAIRNLLEYIYVYII